MNDIIGRPKQCPECFAWTVPGGHHTCVPAIPDMRSMWRTAFGARVRQLREKRDLSQNDVAAVVGVSRASIANIEAGTQDPPLSRIYALAEALRCTPAELVS